ncbi:MAG TPA: helix-turn-helix domain-containing protein [Pyrinomonadaceae bacterium]|nr:helix-turn-helix domain-containing protein [Pyrinomonadaceae bacterium]
MEKLLTVKEAASLLSVSPRTIYAWVAERNIPFHRAGRLLRFDRAELLAWSQVKDSTENLQPDYLRMVG